MDFRFSGELHLVTCGLDVTDAKVAIRRSGKTDCLFQAGKLLVVSSIAKWKPVEEIA